MIHIVDVLLVAGVATVAYVGMNRGAIGQLSVGLGTLVGLFVAAMLFGKFAFLGADSHIRLMLLALLTLAVIFFWYSMALSVGVWARHRLRHALKRFAFFDKATGLLFGIFFASVNIFILLVMFEGVLPGVVARQVVASSILSAAKRSVDIPMAFRNVSHLLQPFASPTVFADQEPTFTYTEPTNWSKNLPAAASRAQASMVKVEAWGCGTESLGSGFWVGQHTVLTNAHVVAGSTRLSIQNSGGVYTAQLVAFDPNTDYALLSTQSDVSGTPLEFDTTALTPDTQVVTLGYPGGGDLTTENAVVLRLLNANGYDIYNDKPVTRQIYALHAAIVPGDSGGPLITDQGKVAGLVFGNSTAQSSTGYAIAASQFVHGILSGAIRDQAVSSGTCTSD